MELSLLEIIRVQKTVKSQGRCLTPKVDYRNKAARQIEFKLKYNFIPVFHNDTHSGTNSWRSKTLVPTIVVQVQEIKSGTACFSFQSSFPLINLENHGWEFLTPFSNKN